MTLNKLLKKRYSIGILLVVSGVIISFFAVKIYTSKYIYDEIDQIPARYRVGVVYGAKLNKDKTPGIYLKDRLDTALQLFYENKIDVIILSGERLDPNFNEIDVMERYILDRGVPIECTYLDTGGLDTYSTVYRVKNIFEFDEVIYITQNFHLTRATFLGKLMGVNCVGLNADHSKYKNLNEHKFREVFANIKAFFDFSNDRQPEVLVDSKDSIH